jgi:t-SNARE complex subunit (syntaxin)
MSKGACSVSPFVTNIRVCLLTQRYGCVTDNIESNVYSIAVDTAGAAEELSTASEYQRKAGRRAACLGLILIIVVTVVLTAVCPIILVTHLRPF